MSVFYVFIKKKFPILIGVICVTTMFLRTMVENELTDDCNKCMQKYNLISITNKAL